MGRHSLFPQIGILPAGLTGAHAHSGLQSFHVLRIMDACVWPPSSSLMVRRYLSSCCSAWQNRIWVLVILMLPEVRRMEKKAGCLHSMVWALMMPINILKMPINILRVGGRRMGPDSFQWCPVTGQGAMGKNWSIANSSWRWGRTSSLWGWWSTGTGCPGRLWSLLLWRYSKPTRTLSCAAYSRWPCFSRGVGLDDTQWSLPTPTILWFCDSDSLMAPVEQQMCTQNKKDCHFVLCSWKLYS